MKRIMGKPDKDIIVRLARLANNPDAKVLVSALKVAQGNINNIWKDIATDPVLHRLQGAGQLMDEIVEWFDKAQDWLEEIKKSEHKL